MVHKHASVAHSPNDSTIFYFPESFTISTTYLIIFIQFYTVIHVNFYTVIHCHHNIHCSLLYKMLYVTVYNYTCILVENVTLYTFPQVENGKMCQNSRFFENFQDFHDKNGQKHSKNALKNNNLPAKL